jgi:hypothetical protein
MDSSTLLSSVLIPLTEKAGEVSQIQDLLGMLEHCFIDAFKMSLPPDTKSDDPDTEAVTAFSPSSSIDAGEEAKLLAVRAVTNFHRNGATRHRAFFERRDYHPHAALFLLELLKSLSGNSQQWFRQLQLDSLEACLAIVEVIGEDNVRLCLPGLVSVAVRYVHRSHHGKDSSKVCLTALKLLRTAFALSFASAEPATWMQDTVTHLTSALRSVLEPAVLVRGSYGAPVVVALESLVTSLLISPAMADYLSSPLGSLLVVAFTVVANMDHLHHLGDDVVGVADADSPGLRGMHVLHTAKEALQLDAALGSSFGVAAVRDALQCLRGVELLHVATSAVRLSALRERFFPLYASHSLVDATPGASSVAEDEAAQAADDETTSCENVIALFLSVVHKCVRIVGTEMGDEALYTHRLPRKFPAGVVDEFLFSLSGALARLPDGSPDAPDSENGTSFAATTGELFTNALLDEYSAILQDWDAYAVHPPVLYVLTRLVLWQFHPSHEAAYRAHCRGEYGDAHTGIQLNGPRCVFPSPSDFMTSGAFEQLWSTVAPPHLWNITENEDLCNNQQIHHRQVVAATLLRFLTLAAEVLSGAPGERREQTQEHMDATERLYALTLYLVLEKATAHGIVHESAMRCVEAYSAASNEADAMSFLLRHSFLIVDETARAVREEYLRAAAASVLRGSLAFLVSRLIRVSSPLDAAQADDDSGVRRIGFGGNSVQLTAIVRQRLSTAEMAAFFQRTGTHLATLEEVAQVADFVSSTIHVAQDTLFLCSRYDSTAAAEDLEGRRAALALMRDALDLAAYLNFSVPQEALDEDQERHTTSAHTRVRALQSAALDAVYTVLQHCTVHDAAAPLAVQAVVRGLTCFLTSGTAVAWAEKTRQRLHDAETERRRKKRAAAGAGNTGAGKAFMENVLAEDGSKSEAEKSEVEGEDEEDDDCDDQDSRAALPASPPLDWPWTHYVASQTTLPAEATDTAAPAVHIELPRSHLHTVYRVYLSLFALLREPMAAFATVAATTGPGARSGMERRKLADVSVTPTVFEALNGLESIRLLACDFLLHRMVEEVLPLVILWHERGCVSRIPTHTEERVKAATQQFVVRLLQDCRGSSGLEERVAAQCRGYPLLSAVTARAEELATSAPEEQEGSKPTLLAPQATRLI